MWKPSGVESCAMNLGFRFGPIFWTPSGVQIWTPPIRGPLGVHLRWGTQTPRCPPGVHLRWGTQNPGAKRELGQKSWQHPKDFPSGPPPQYYPGPAAVNFGVLKRSGVFAAVWPPANIVLLFGLIPRFDGFSAIRWPIVETPKFQLLGFTDADFSRETAALKFRRSAVFQRFAVPEHPAIRCPDGASLQRIAEKGRSVLTANR